MCLSVCVCVCVYFEKENEIQIWKKKHYQNIQIQSIMQEKSNSVIEKINSVIGNITFLSKKKNNITRETIQEKQNGKCTHLNN